MSEFVWITEQSVMRIHDRSLARHGGASGVRDANLLQSALARPLQHHAYAQTVDICELAAILTYGIVKNHPFVDGNKRTGFVAGIAFLQSNGSRFSASNLSQTPPSGA